MQVITTRYHGPSLTKPARISATTAGGRRIYMPLESDKMIPDRNDEQRHVIAAHTLCAKLKWTDERVTGCLEHGVYVHVLTPKKPAIQSITIFGRRWFDRGPGNTYCTATIYINGEFVVKTPVENGYGVHYLTVAGDWLEIAGKISREKSSNGEESLWQMAERLGFRFAHEVVNVAKESDL